LFIFLVAELVNDNMAEYFAPTSSPSRKRLVLQQIVESIYEQHGRFLKRDGAADTWVPISKEEAALKTAMALQYRARKQSPLTTGPQTCVPVPQHTVQVVPTPIHHSQSSPARPFDIFASHLPRVMRVSPPVPVQIQRPTALAPQPIRISSTTAAGSHRYLPGYRTRECYPSYQYLRQLYSQAYQHCSTERHAASMHAQPREHTRFESFSRPQQPRAAVAYSSESVCDDSDWVECGESTRHSSHEDATWRSPSIAPSPCIISESFWEPLPLLLDDHHSSMGQSLVRDPNELLSEMSDSSFNDCFETVEPLDLSLLLDLDLLSELSDSSFDASFDADVPLDLDPSQLLDLTRPFDEIVCTAQL
jgi:hypothetical protein